ncbi:glycosyltransferase family 2 protein [Mangrovimonas sp. DI 80]|uniref:glycosyltransferase family 2 protein n=1 Tax=Mangrovimonas sp. DI 80 TaxID=1779330 RepID=UPI000977DD48|nr:glycosyltransferase family 2 protein [Mangrovimonas sp. DI 80]OMP31788.1 glycosyl transferase [Mangrovimonas sp. DI 80]
MNYPKISIITPSYNQGEFLEETILSVLSQNYPNLEYIVIDGGSSDQSVDIIKKYEAQLAYWVSEPDKGTWEANNKGLEKVTGDYWCVVNSDDLLCKGALNKIANYIEEHGAFDWLAGGVEYIDEKSQLMGTHVPKKPLRLDEQSFLNGCWISHPAVFLSSKLIVDKGMFKRYHLLDLNYWLRLEHAGYRPIVYPDALSALRMHSDCKSADRFKLHEEYLRVIEDFIRDHDVSITPEIQELLYQKQLYKQRLLLQELLVSKDTTAALAGLFRLFKDGVNERWYWGLWKRMLFGMSENDPLLNDFDRNESKANWN